ncbi:hypothetical protein QZH41_020281 [Actinostola sp. cb2023]|nr:hypothetical protein QZH41_020281 [Actinostola sp. cb2023]
MNIKILLLLCLVTILVLPDAEAWGRRRRRWFRIRRVVRWACRTSCKGIGFCVLYLEAPQGQNADWGYWGSCGFRLLCDGINGDRVLGPLSNGQQDEPVFDQITLAMPSRLPEYDTNEDGRISTDEFSSIHPQPSDMESTASVFDDLDTNGDKYIDCPEFLDAKMHFDDKPTC